MRVVLTKETQLFAFDWILSWILANCVNVREETGIASGARVDSNQEKAKKVAILTATRQLDQFKTEITARRR